MFQNLSYVLSRTQPHCPVLLQKLQHDVLELLRVFNLVGFLVGKDDACMQNFALEHLFVLIEKRCDTEHHLKDKHTDRPPVHCVVVTDSLHHLRCQVLRCSAIALGKVVSHLFSESIINTLNIAALINKYILQF